MSSANFLLPDSRFPQIETHVNLLKHTDVPHVLGTHPHPSDPIPQAGRIPWINTDVIITGRHLLRTYPAIVKDVLCGQETPSGLKLVVQLTRLDSNAPFRDVTLDYDDVVEAR